MKWRIVTGSMHSDCIHVFNSSGDKELVYSPRRKDIYYHAHGMNNKGCDYPRPPHNNIYPMDIYFH